jgi:MFS transporter, FHS family, glucose/mannose:H+ symporter
VLHFSARHSIQLAAMLTVAMTLGRLVIGAVLRRVAWFPVLASCLVAAAMLVLVGLVATGSAAVRSGAPVAAWVVFVFPLVGFFLGPIYPVINSAILSSLAVHRQGVLASLGVLFSACGSSLGTWLVGCLIEAYGGRAALSFTLLPICGLLAFLYFLHRRTRGLPTPQSVLATVSSG